MNFFKKYESQPAYTAAGYTPTAGGGFGSKSWDPDINAWVPSSQYEQKQLAQKSTAASESREAGRFAIEQGRFGLEKEKFGIEKEKFGIEKPLLQKRAASEMYQLGLSQKFRPQQEQLMRLQLQQQAQEAQSKMRFRSFLNSKLGSFGGGFGGDFGGGGDYSGFGGYGGGVMDVRNQPLFPSSSKMIQPSTAGLPTGGNTFSRSYLASGFGGGYPNFPSQQNKLI